MRRLDHRHRPFVLGMSLFDNLTLSLSRMYPYYTQHITACCTTTPPSRLPRVRPLHSPSSFWVPTAFYSRIRTVYI
jgi:hypothetical protein